MIRQFELVERVREYDNEADEAMLNRAYVFSMKAHGMQKRASGDPYFSHPLEVAGILTDYKLDCATIVTALLHDTVEDTVATLGEIEELFGGEIAKMVDGVTKLSKLELRSEANQQAENFRKLLLAMSDDIRVLLVKLADRLHNMRTLHFIVKKDKRRRIAVETMEIYAPLAERLGMHGFKEEMEDISFRELNEDVHKSIRRRIEYLEQDNTSLIDEMIAELRQILDDAGLPARISGRRKKPFSIWRKMERSNIPFEQLTDVVAFRIVVDGIPDCYQALGIVHGHYPMVPERFKDYISVPKDNGYRSLHSAVIGPKNRRIEVQIRTQDMDDAAERGIAAHWSYKQGIDPAERKRYRWLQQMVDILETASTPEEFLEHSKLEMFSDQVFVFTPKGDVVGMPRGSTPVDFAYAVHTDVGNTAVGAKVNGRGVPLRTQLRNGDQVDILRSNTATPNANWENFVVTGKARSAIRGYVRHRERDEYERLGHSLVQKAFRDAGHEISDNSLDHALKALNMKSQEELYRHLGQGHLKVRELMKKVFPGDRRWSKINPLDAINRLLPMRLRRESENLGENPIHISGLQSGMALHYGECCHPLPGDRIVGIIEKGQGVNVHTIDCPTLEAYDESDDNWLDVKWELDPKNPSLYVGRIAVYVPNEPGSLSTLSAMIAKNMGNISNLRITERQVDYFQMVVDIEVTDVKHLTNIIAALRATPSINQVERVIG